MTAQTRLFMCRSDNFGVLLHDPKTGATAAIDAPEAAPIELALQQTGWKLTDILVTHHHADHTDGIMALKTKWKCRVTVPAAEADKIPGVDATVKEGDKVKVGTLIGNVIETPGHTLGHIVYWFHADNLLFAADNLFSVGCGRVIEGTMDQMWSSMQKMNDLPDETKVFCGHEYTAANIKFALSVDKGNAALLARASEAAKQRAAGQPTIPTTIGEEKKVNPFLRAGEASIAANLSMAGKPANEVFAELRERKNKF